MILRKYVTLLLLLLWGLLHSNSCIASSQKIWKIQKIYLNNGDSLRGYVKLQIIGDDYITFSTEKGDTIVDVTDICKIMSDVESEDNINRTQRRYIVENDTITGRYVGEIPGQALYVEMDGKIDTIYRTDVKEWSLVFSKSELNAPMLDKITERREDGILGESKKGIIVYQNYNTENNVLRLMLEDGGFETIRIRDIDRLEKVNNDKYMPHIQLLQDDDSCMVNGVRLKFIKGVCKDTFDVKQLSRIIFPYYAFKMDFKVDIVVIGKILDLNKIKILPLTYTKKAKKEKVKIRVLNEAFNFENKYDEYANITTIEFRFKIAAGQGNGFVFIDIENKRYLPIQFSNYGN